MGKKVREAAARDKPILCDKPLALTLREAGDIIQVARESKVKLMVPFNPRFQGGDYETSCQCQPGKFRP